MSKNSEQVTSWRRRTKKRLNAAFGDKCAICGYDKCPTAMDLHHLDPTMKEFSFGKITANPKSWIKIVAEARKCVLLCCRCHREVHNLDGVEVPKDAPRFNEEYVDYKEHGESLDECPVCQTLKPKFNITCSKKCGASRRYRVNWDDIDLIALKKELGSNVAVGDHLGVSDATIGKRLKHLYCHK
jgi:hypothetical protein